MIPRPVGKLPLTNVERRGIKRLVTRLEEEEDMEPVADLRPEDAEQEKQRARIAVDVIRSIVAFV